MPLAEMSVWMSENGVRSHDDRAEVLAGMIGMETDYIAHRVAKAEEANRDGGDG